MAQLVHTELDGIELLRNKLAGIGRFRMSFGNRTSSFGSSTGLSFTKDDERQLFIDKLIKHIEHDNLKLLQKIQDRTEKVGVKLPTIEGRYRNFCVEADCQIAHGKALPTLWNSMKYTVSDDTITRASWMWENHLPEGDRGVTYNGYKLDEFIPQKTSAYISQYDLHIPEMTVRETFDFSARCQGVGSRE
ncbi:hypothetical protein CRG98_026543, partial [Punica granatum]